MISEITYKTLLQKRHNSSTQEVELHPLCIKPSVWLLLVFVKGTSYTHCNKLVLCPLQWICCLGTTGFTLLANCLSIIQIHHPSITQCGLWILNSFHWISKIYVLCVYVCVNFFIGVTQIKYYYFHYGFPKMKIWDWFNCLASMCGCAYYEIFD